MRSQTLPAPSTERPARGGDRRRRGALLLAGGRRPVLLEPAWPNARELRWIQSASAGVNSVLFPALVESEVVLTNARGVFDEPIAEYVMGLVIAFAKGFPATFDDQRRREWGYRWTEPVAGKQLLVVGPGPIGRAVGRAARALGMRVSAVGRTPRDGDGLFGTVRGRERLHEALRRGRLRRRHDAPHGCDATHVRLGRVRRDEAVARGS